MNSTQDSDPILDVTNWVLNYINENCIYRVAPGEEMLPGKPDGNKYIWQFYLRRGLTNPRFLRAVGLLFWFRFNELYKAQPFQITGLETGATPLVTALSITANNFYGISEFNAFITRAERKTYGLFNRFEGIIDYSLPVMLVDDMCNSKNTMMRAMQHCRDEGLKIYKYGFTIVNKDVDGIHTDHDKYIGDEFKVISLFKHSDFILDWKSYEDYCSLYKINRRPFERERFVVLNSKS